MVDLGKTDVFEWFFLDFEQCILYGDAAFLYSFQEFFIIVHSLVSMSRRTPEYHVSSLFFMFAFCAKKAVS